MEFKLRLRETGSQLWTREVARPILERLLRLLEKAGSGDVVVIDANGVQVFDYSFANELFGKSLLALPREYAGRFLIVEDLGSHTHENLCKALESLELTMIHRKGSRLELIGKVHPTDDLTFRALVRARQPITAAKLGSELDVNLTAMNERLAKLVRLGLVRREISVSQAGREQYEYTVLR